jgi:hypothetical protein
MHDIETINSLGKHEGSGVNSKETHENWLKKTRKNWTIIWSNQEVNKWHLNWKSPKPRGVTICIFYETHKIKGYF